MNELQNRNRPDMASSYTRHPPEHRDLQSKPNLNDKEPVLDIVAANMNKVIHDPSKARESNIIITCLNFFFPLGNEVLLLMI